MPHAAFALACVAPLAGAWIEMISLRSTSMMPYVDSFAEHRLRLGGIDRKRSLTNRLFVAIVNNSVLSI